MVTVLAVAPLLAILHRASVRHAVCEHGDLIEPAHGSEQAPPDARAASSDVDELHLASGARWRGDEAPAFHSHDHCPVATLARAGTAVAASTSIVVSVARGSQRELSEADGSTVRGVLANAPKTSPPRVRLPIFA
jgi:hypothetical protein